jgi:hypothetical protein
MAPDVILNLPDDDGTRSSQVLAHRLRLADTNW